MDKLKIFIGSSTEYKELATKIAACIDESGEEAKIWTDYGLFPAGKYLWDRLRQLTRQFDGAIFIFGCDDEIDFRGQAGYQPRDNVLIEYGLFSGQLPTEAVVFLRVGRSKKPVDLDGLTFIDDEDGNFSHSTEMRLKEWLNSVRMLYRKPLDGINSIFPFMEFRTDNANVARVRRFSESCKEFYGYADWADLSNKSAAELVDSIMPYIKPPAPHWDDFQEDQASVIKKHEQGHLPLAQVPIRFNSSHPRFPKRTFVPLIVEKIGEGAGSITRILYLDTAQLPKGVFGEPIWSELSDTIDPKMLSLELKQMADDWIRTVPGVAPERVKALKEAAEEAAKGGSVKVITYCGEAGFFAVRGLAQKGDYPNARVLLGRLLALTQDDRHRNLCEKVRELLGRLLARTQDDGPGSVS